MLLIHIHAQRREKFVQQTVAVSIKILLPGYAQIRFQFVLLKYEITVTMFGIQKCRSIQKIPCCSPCCLIYFSYTIYCIHPTWFVLHIMHLRQGNLQCQLYRTGSSFRLQPYQHSSTGSLILHLCSYMRSREGKGIPQLHKGKPTEPVLKEGSPFWFTASFPVSSTAHI